MVIVNYIGATISALMLIQHGDDTRHAWTWFTSHDPGVGIVYVSHRLDEPASIEVLNLS